MGTCCCTVTLDCDEVDTGSEPGRINFSDFDAELDLEAPAEDEVFDISQFQPGAS